MAKAAREGRPALDTICTVIARHRHAFAVAAKDTGLTAWSQADDAAETLLETTPSTIRGIIALLDHVVEIERKHSPNIWPDPCDGGDTFHCRLLAHVAAALTRLLANADAQCVS
jgi:hypothetical protein